MKQSPKQILLLFSCFNYIIFHLPLINSSFVYILDILKLYFPTNVACKGASTPLTVKQLKD